jgi:acetyl-CoA C-acetyltransferase
VAPTPSEAWPLTAGRPRANGEAPAIGRVAALDAGFPVSVPGLQLDRRCGSGLQTIVYAAMQVQTGVSDIVVAGGDESMSQAEHYSPQPSSSASADAAPLLEPRLSAAGSSRRVASPADPVATANKR